MDGASGHLLFVPGSQGYEILVRSTPPPSVGSDVELDGSHYVVSKLGPSPYPGDERRCAYLQARP
jgi:hypothetical protein